MDRIELDAWKQETILASGGLCAACRSRPISEFDHIIPRSQLGKDEPENLLPTCSECHRLKTANILSWGLDGNTLWIYRGEDLVLRRPWPPTQVGTYLLGEVHQSARLLSAHRPYLSALDDHELLDYVGALREAGEMTYHLQCLALAEAQGRRLHSSKMEFYQAASEVSGISLSRIRERTKVGEVFGERLLQDDIQRLPQGHLELLAHAEKPLEALELALDKRDEQGTLTLQELQDVTHARHDKRYCHFWTSDDGTAGECLFAHLGQT